MKIVETIKICAELLKFMSRNGIFIDDWKYIEAYDQFRHMRSLGIKYDKAISDIASDRNISKRTLQRAIKRLSKEC